MDWRSQKKRSSNIRSTVEAIKALIDEKNIRVFEKHKVLNRTELYSRYEILLESYIKTINIEALTMIEMTKRDIIPAVIGYITKLADSINTVKATGVNADTSVQAELLQEVSSLLAELKRTWPLLKIDFRGSRFQRWHIQKSMYVQDDVFVRMNELRAVADKLETLVDSKMWPFRHTATFSLTCNNLYRIRIKNKN